MIFNLKKILLVTTFIGFSLNIFSIGELSDKTRNELRENILKFSDSILNDFNANKKELNSLLKSVDSFFAHMKFLSLNLKSHEQTH